MRCGLALPHPLTGNRVEWEAPLAADMENLLAVISGEADV